MRRYLDLLRAPGVAPLFAASTIGRLPYGMNVLALILLLRSEGLDYAEVGIVTGAAGLAVGVTGPVIGRLVDRVGQTRVLVATALGCLAADATLVAAALSGAGVVPLTLLAVVGGGSTPPVSPAMRTLWPELVGRERVDSAFALDALQLELFFIAGPLLAAGLATLISPEVAFLSGVTMQAPVPSPSRPRAPHGSGGRCRCVTGAAQPPCRRPACGRCSRRSRSALSDWACSRSPSRPSPSAKRAGETPAGCSRSGASARWRAGSGTERGAGGRLRIAAS
jgi:Major Facilitator Superfamily